MESANMSMAGYVQGRFGPELLVCEYWRRISSRGSVWYGCNPFGYVLPLVLFQIVVVIIFSGIVYFILKHFTQSTLSCQIIAGLVLGPSSLGRDYNSFPRKLFTTSGQVVLETVANVGFIFHILIQGINIDVDMAKKAGKEAIAVGIASFMTPFTFGFLSIFLLLKVMPSPEIPIYTLLFLVTANSMTSSAGTTSHLSDLQILNSDIGRMATLASMVNDCCNYILYIAMSAMATLAKQKKLNALWSIVWNSILFCFLVCIVRPWMVRFARSLPEGQSLKENYFLGIIIPALICGFLTEAMGMPVGFGTFLFGAAIPEGPPLGTFLVNRLDSFCTGLLVPAKFAIAGFSVNIFLFKRTCILISIIIFLGYLAKFMGVLILAIFYRIPLWESVCLSLIMCCKGVVELSVFMTVKESGMITDEAFAILVIGKLLVTGLARPLVLRLYDPSRRYAAKHTNSILSSNQSHLRVVVCIYGEDNVGPILHLLAASNPTRESSISVFIINLMDLKSRAAAVLECNVYKGSVATMLSRTEHIVNAFDSLANINQGALSLRHFTSIAPYTTMHSDICTIALDVQAHIIIIPFHKQKQIDGSCETNAPGIRLVNKNVIENAPSTVGILIDRSHMAGTLQPLGTGSSFMRIFVLFLGGEDDREALAFGSRMIGQPNLNITLVWLRPLDRFSMNRETDTSLDADMVRHFRANTIGNDSVNYREEVATDAVGTTRVLRSFEGACELCIVGRYHPPDSPLTQGMDTDWGECPELGSLGDMLAGSDFRYSVLVVKQQTVNESEFLKQHSFSFSV